MNRFAAVIASLAAATTVLSQVDTKFYQSMEWRNIGPFRGGRSVAVAGVTSDTQTYYFGSVGGGIWKSTDGGESWANITDNAGLKTSSVGAIAVAPSDPNVIYAGMGEHAVRGVATSHGDGVYKSTDAGRTWKHIGLEKTRAISRIRIHPSNPDIVLVAAQGAPFGPTKDRGVYRSKDGGKTWDLVLAGVNETSGASELAMDPNNPRVLYAAFWDHLRKPWEVRSGGPGSGIWKSVDGGDTWSKINEGLPKVLGKIGIDAAANSDRLYAIVEADPEGGLYRSENGGKNWTLINSTWALKTRAWYYMEVFADPKNPDTVWVLNAGAHKSIDGGRTFTPVRAPHGDHHDLWINPQQPDVMINANDGGANISFNGGRTWSTQDNQPTAQFYRVNTDNRFPYWVYGGQQDNTSVGIASRAGGPGIGWKDWHPVGGCESAYVAFDPNDPRYVYAGCYMGMISEYDASLDDDRDIAAYPTMPAALPSREMKYRFNWNAPILVSQYDPKVIYHASQLLLRTDDRGRTWKELSPDLTRPDDRTQGPGGGPITNEGAGGEIYNTIFYVAESRQDRNTLWTGSDDGTMHVTRDGGKTWKKLMLPGLEDAQINSIEASPHDAGTIYVAATRYKFNDFTPLFFKSVNYGETWERIVDGIGADAWARVIREDPARRGLLYAGTELGMYVSFDAGKKWQTLQLNLPLTPITDLKVQGNDLVAATSGRAFWILDNLSPLRQLNAEVTRADGAHLFQPTDAIRTNLNTVTPPAASRLGKNPPAGAVIDFYVAEAGKSPVIVEILNAAGNVVREYSTEKKEGQTAASLTVKAGMNRMVWNLRTTAAPPIAGVFLFTPPAGRKAVPGTYTVRLKAAGKSLTQPLVVKRDPRVSTTSEQYAAQDALASSVEKDLTELQGEVMRLRRVREQVEDWMKRAKDQPEGAAVDKAGKSLAGKLNAVEEVLIQKKTVDGQTVINFPVRLQHHLAYLLAAVDSGEGVNEGARLRAAELSKQWARQKDELSKLLGAEVEAFNKLVREKVQPVVVPAVGSTK